MKSFSIECSDNSVRKALQKEIDGIFLSNFLQGGQGFGYDTYRSEVLCRSMNLPGNCQNTIKHIVGLMDLNIPGDFLKYLNLNFNPSVFSRESYEKSLGTALRPKNFNLPEFTEFEDFTRQVILDFDRSSEEKFSESFDSFLAEVGLISEEGLPWKKGDFVRLLKVAQGSPCSPSDKVDPEKVQQILDSLEDEFKTLDSSDEE